MPMLEGRGRVVFYQGVGGRNRDGDGDRQFHRFLPYSVVLSVLDREKRLRVENFGRVEGWSLSDLNFTVKFRKKYPILPK